MNAPFVLPLTHGKKTALLLFCGLCALVLAVLSVIDGRSKHAPFNENAMRAVEQVRLCHDEIRKMRLELGLPIDPALDPAMTGLIGEDYTDLTTTLGDLHAKQVSLSPYFAGLIVQWLEQSGIRPGAEIAVTFTGSFPGLNISALCAFDALGVRPVIFSTVGASTHGANIVGLAWPDMESRLFQKGLIQHRSRWMSLGGIMDTGGGIDETGIPEAEAAIARHGAEYIREGTSMTVAKDVERRMTLYPELDSLQAYVNVGGGVTPLGWVAEAALLDNGLIERMPSCTSPQRGLLFRFHELGIPVIHLLNIDRLAAEYGIPTAADKLYAPYDRAHSQRQKDISLILLLGGWFLLGAALLRRS